MLCWTVSQGMMGESHVRLTPIQLAWYARDQSTSERHRRGAELALETCNALESLQLWFMDEIGHDAPERLLYEFCRKLKRLLSQLRDHPHTMHEQQGDTYLQSSVIMGFALVLHRYRGMNTHYMGCRRCLLHESCGAGYPSQWRCRRHTPGLGCKPWANFSYSSDNLNNGLIAYTGHTRPVSTLCGVCKLEPVDGLSATGPGADAHFTWHIPEVGVDMIVMRTVHEYSNGRGRPKVPQPELFVRLGLVRHTPPPVQEDMQKS